MNGLILQGQPVPGWGFVNLLYPMTAGGCLVCLMAGVLKPRFRSAWLLAYIIPFCIHVVMAMIIGWEPGSMWQVPGTWLPWYLGGLIAVSCIFYKGPMTARVYLCVTFYTLYLLVIQLLEHTGNSLFQLALDVKLPFTGSHRPVPVFYSCPLFGWIPFPEDAARGSMYNAIFWMALGGACILLALSCRYLWRKIRKRTWNLKWKELAFLLLPDITGISFYIFMSFVRQMLFEEKAVDLAARFGPGIYLLIPALTLAALGAILYSCDIYEQILAFGQEKGRLLMLESQVQQMEGHIQDIEQLYTGIRSMKHDMQNYLFDIKSLLNSRGIRVEDEKEGLGVYFSGIGKTLNELDYTYHTGNPVTDVVVNGKYRQARHHGIGFECSFLFPAQYGISAFDISIILNNALNNALEACERLRVKKPDAVLQIRLEAYCRNNMFLIEIDNTFDGVLRYEEKGYLLVTRKENSFEHGLGFQNICQCADKYLGAVEHRYSENRFYLTVMLQRVSEKQI